MAEVVAAIARLRERASVLIVEQMIDLILGLAERANVMVNGRIAYEGEAHALQRDRELQVRPLGV